MSTLSAEASWKCRDIDENDLGTLADWATSNVDFGILSDLVDCDIDGTKEANRRLRRAAGPRRAEVSILKLFNVVSKSDWVG